MPTRCRCGFWLLDDVQGHKKEIREREETVVDKDKRIYDLRKKNQELEKFKFVLNYKIQELKRQIMPRKKEIQDMREQIMEMEVELLQYHKSNAALDLMIGTTLAWHGGWHRVAHLLVCTRRRAAAEEGGHAKRDQRADCAVAGDGGNECTGAIRPANCCAAEREPKGAWRCSAVRCRWRSRLPWCSIDGRPLVPLTLLRVRCACHSY
jgi:hypothetical protein